MELIFYPLLSRDNFFVFIAFEGNCWLVWELFLQCWRWGLYLVMYTRGIQLFFGLSAKRLSQLCCRASLKYCLISWILYPFQSAWICSCWGLTSCYLGHMDSWDDCSCHESTEDWIGVAWHLVEILIHVSSLLVWCAFLISSVLEFSTLLPLYTVVSKNVIACFDAVWVNLRRWWKLLAVRKKSVI